MGYGIKVRASGEYACFSRIEFKVERVSYDAITPSAARGVLEAVYWHPGMRWVIDSITVLRPIRFMNLRRNELKGKVSASNVLTAMNSGDISKLPVLASDDINQRATLLLRDVEYVIEAHFDMSESAAASDTPEKFYNIILRRLRRGQCYSQPYLGTREFPARVELVEDGAGVAPCAELMGERDLGFMLYDCDYSDPGDIKPRFFRAVMRDGVIDLRDCEVFE